MEGYTRKSATESIGAGDSEMFLYNISWVRPLRLVFGPRVYNHPDHYELPTDCW